MEKLRLIKFPDYSYHTSVNDADQDFVTKFLSAADSVAPIQTTRVKSKTKPWFHSDVLNAIQTVISTIKNLNGQTQGQCYARKAFT